jgi:hypothetical protein
MEIPDYTNLEFLNCSDIELRILGKAYDNKIKKYSKKLLVETKKITITEVRIKHRDSLKQEFEIKATGLARSIKQDDVELLPTKIDKILDSSPSEKGLWGLLFALLLFAGGIFMKRAIDVLSEYFIPDLKSKK